MTDYDELLRETTKGLLAREADSYDWTTGVEWQVYCDGCRKGVWAESATQADDQWFCEACVTEMSRELEEAMSR